MRSGLKHSHAAVSFLFHSKVHIQFSSCATNRFLVEPKKMHRGTLSITINPWRWMHNTCTHTFYNFSQRCLDILPLTDLKHSSSWEKISANMNSHIQSFLLPHLGPGSPENNSVGKHFSEHKNQILIRNNVSSNWIIAA